jgi:RNA polymerase sigma factor (sigma-70 family)
MDEELDNWFTREILSHEESFVRYLVRVWPYRDDVLDLRQDAYIRVYEAAAKARPVAPKSFLFTTARNIMTDRVRRRQVVSIETRQDFDTLDGLVDEISAEQVADAYQQLRHLAEAFNQLPPRCREVMWMRRVEGLTQKEVAGRLNVSEGTVEKHVARGVRLLAFRMYGMSSKEDSQDKTGGVGIESDDGQYPA